MRKFLAAILISFSFGIVGIVGCNKAGDTMMKSDSMMKEDSMKGDAMMKDSK